MNPLKCLAIAAAVAVLPPARADWQRTDTTLAWAAGKTPVWQFSFDPAKGKPFFHPITVDGGPSLTNFRPTDHPWHYALWFSWKYINGANFWEEDRDTGKSVGKTSWSTPVIATRADGSATIELNLRYANPSGRVDLTEARTIAVSAPDASGGYTIDWSAEFTAGPEGAVLDRTPMPNEPHGAVNGGYAGLSMRLAAAPLTIAMTTAEGPVTEFAHNRARPNSAAVACSFSDGGKPVGAIAILSDPANLGEKAPWYLINSDEFRFANAAVLAPEMRRLPPGGTWKLRYRITVQKAPWTPEALRAALTAWLHS